MRCGEVWLLLDSSGLGGIESHVLELSEALRERGMIARILFLKEHGDHPLWPLLDARQVPYSVLDGRLSSLLAAMVAARPKLIHTHGYKAGIQGRLAGMVSRVPVVSTFHSGDPGAGKVRLYNRLDRATAFLAREVVAVSSQIAAALPTDARVIGNFVRLGRKRSSAAANPAFVGRLSREKGPDLFCRLSTLLPGREFTIYGDGPMRSELEDHYPRVRFAGQQRSMTDRWREIGVLCMTSRHEGLPLAALEAMSHGVPVAAFAVGGLPDLIEHRKNGWLVNPGDLAGFARALEEWKEMDRDGRERMADHARRVVTERFTPDALMPRLLDVYAAALA
jgi:glycosyltransferase involved in cell wall biosynthesis